MFKQISCLEAEDLINDSAAVVADVRDRESYDESHINGAIHLSVAALQDFCESVDKNQSILVYCYHGISSQSVAQHLADQGFSSVYSLMGGFEMWCVHHPTSDDS